MQEGQAKEMFVCPKGHCTDFVINLNDARYYSMWCHSCRQSWEFNEWRRYNGNSRVYDKFNDTEGNEIRVSDAGNPREENLELRFKFVHRELNLQQAIRLRDSLEIYISDQMNRSVRRGKIK